MPSLAVLVCARRSFSLLRMYALVPVPYLLSRSETSRNYEDESRQPVALSGSDPDLPRTRRAQQYQSRAKAKVYTRP